MDFIVKEIIKKLDFLLGRNSGEQKETTINPSVKQAENKFTKQE